MGAPAITAISDARWAEAQAGELAFWEAADRRQLARQLDRVYMQTLGITADTVRGRSVLDLGGGPLPLAALFALPVASYTVVDPLPVVEQLTYPMLRIVAPAETYFGPPVDEVWGYNVLQHVIDPAAVLRSAKEHGRLVRWFDWVDTPIEDHHPHSLSADWLREQFDGWRIVSDQRQAIPVGLSYPQSYIAIVAERPLTSN